MVNPLVGLENLIALRGGMTQRWETDTWLVPSLLFY